MFLHFLGITYYSLVASLVVLAFAARHNSFPPPCLATGLTTCVCYRYEDDELCTSGSEPWREWCKTQLGLLLYCSHEISLSTSLPHFVPSALRIPHTSWQVLMLVVIDPEVEVTCYGRSTREVKHRVCSRRAISGLFHFSLLFSPSPS